MNPNRLYLRCKKTILTTQKQRFYLLKTTFLDHENAVLASQNNGFAVQKSKNSEKQVFFLPLLLLIPPRRSVKFWHFFLTYFVLKNSTQRLRGTEKNPQLLRKCHNNQLFLRYSIHSWKLMWIMWIIESLITINIIIQISGKNFSHTLKALSSLCTFVSKTDSRGD